MSFNIPTPRTELVEEQFKGSQSSRNPMSAGEAYGKAIKLAYSLERELETVKESLRLISLASQNSASSKEDCGRIARVCLRYWPLNLPN